MNRNHATITLSKDILLDYYKKFLVQKVAAKLEDWKMTYKGKKYESLTKLGKATKIHYRTIERMWSLYGRQWEKYIDKHKKKMFSIAFNGKTYYNRKDLMEAIQEKGLHANYKTVKRYSEIYGKNWGKYIEKSITDRKDLLTYEGKTYKNITKMLKSINISHRKFDKLRALYGKDWSKYVKK